MSARDDVFLQARRTPLARAAVAELASRVGVASLREHAPRALASAGLHVATVIAFAIASAKESLDPTFTAQANTSEGPYAIQLGANRMYVGGNFTEVASTPVASGGASIKQAGIAVYPPLQ